MGLEIADIISYGYNLQKYKCLTQTHMYRPIRKVLLRRNKVVKKEMGIDCVIEEKKRGRTRQSLHLRTFYNKFVYGQEIHNKY